MANHNKAPKYRPSAEEQIESASKGNKGARSRNGRREERERKQTGEVILKIPLPDVPPASEFLANHSEQARTPMTEPEIKTQHFAPRDSRLNNYDEDGRPAIRPDTRIYSVEPEIKREPELSRKPFKERTHPISLATDASGFVQVETKPGLAWTEPEQKVHKLRAKRSIPAIVDAEPSIQVETKSNANARVAQAREAKKSYEAEVAVREKYRAERERDIVGMTTDEVAEYDNQQLSIDWAAAKFEDDQRVAATASASQDANPAVFRSNRMRPITVEKEDVPSGINLGDRTPAEWKEKLRWLIIGAKEKFDWYKSSEEHLIRRLADLNAQAEKVPGLEKKFREWGENYNKMPFKYKAIIGTALGLGTVATSGTLAVALPLLGIGIQRVRGLASMYLKYEKNSHDEKWGSNTEWGKQKAMLKAGLYTIILGATMKEAIELASGTEFAHAAQAKVESWLGSILGHFQTSASEMAKPAPTIVAPVVTSVADVAPSAEMMGPPAPEAVPAAATAISQPAAAAAAGEHVSRSVAQHIDIARPEAPTHFEMPKQADFRYHGDDDMSVSAHDVTPTASGELVDQDVGATIPTDADVPAAESVPVQAEAQPSPEMPVQAEAAPAIAPEAPHADQPLPTGEVPQPETYAKVDLTPDQEAVDRAAETITMTPAPVEPPALESPAMHTYAAPETQSPAPVIEHSIVSNQFGLDIPVAESRVYAGVDVRNTFVFGGSPVERAKAILEYLTKNPDKVVFGADDSGKYRVPWHLVEGKITPGVPMRTSGLFGFFSTWMKPPGPEDLKTLIK